MPSPIFADECGRRVATRRCWTCGAPVPMYPYSAHTMSLLKWEPGKIYLIGNHCGDIDDYVMWPTTEAGWYLPVPLWSDEKAKARFAPGQRSGP